MPDDVSVCSGSSHSSRFHPLNLIRRCSNSFNCLLIALITLFFKFGELGDASALLKRIERKLCDR